MNTNDISRLTLLYTIAPGVDIWNEINWIQHYICELEGKIEMMSNLNALGASREYRTPEIHRAHLDQFASRERELKLLKNHLAILETIYTGLPEVTIQIEPV